MLSRPFCLSGPHFRRGPHFFRKETCNHEPSKSKTRAVQRRFAGSGYAAFKSDLAEAIVEFLRPIQQRCRAILEDGKGLEAVLKAGAETARARSRAVLGRVHAALGFIPCPAA